MEYVSTTGIEYNLLPTEDKGYIYNSYTNDSGNDAYKDKGEWILETKYNIGKKGKTQETE